VDVVVEPDVVLLPGVILQGSCVIGSHAEIGPDTHLVDTVVGEGARVASSVCRRSLIGADARIGPFAVLGEGTEVAPGAVVVAAFQTGSDQGPVEGNTEGEAG
jgi:bifunctional UDP-N-acetylglucosamine pyrophosphorylase / glucosamine-1-phosphate N-acetyltransferase